MSRLEFDQLQSKISRLLGFALLWLKNHDYWRIGNLNDLNILYSFERYKERNRAIEYFSRDMGWGNNGNSRVDPQVILHILIKIIKFFANIQM